MNTINVIGGRLYQAHSVNVRRTDMGLSLRDLIIIWGGFREIINRSYCSGSGEDDQALPAVEHQYLPAGEHQYLPAEEYAYLLLCFDDTYYSIRIR